VSDEDSVGLQSGSQSGSQSGPNIGPHICRFEEPDTIYMEFHGPVSLAEGREVNRRHEEWGKQYDHLFFLINLKELDGIDPTVRKEAGPVMRAMPLRGAMAYAAPLKARVAAKLILTAVNLFRKEADRMPFSFVATEADARAGIERRRRELGLTAPVAARG
jgi:hypothetical protein